MTGGTRKRSSPDGRVGVDSAKTDRFGHAARDTDERCLCRDALSGPPCASCGRCNALLRRDMAPLSSIVHRTRRLGALPREPCSTWRGKAWISSGAGGMSAPMTGAPRQLDWRNIVFSRLGARRRRAGCRPGRASRVWSASTTRPSRPTRSHTAWGRGPTIARRLRGTPSSPRSSRLARAITTFTTAFRTITETARAPR
jgi:hypothetical protein